MVKISELKDRYSYQKRISSETGYPGVQSKQKGGRLGDGVLGDGSYLAMLPVSVVYII